MSLLAYTSDDLKPEHISRSARPPEPPNYVGGPGTTMKAVYWARDPEVPIAPTAMYAEFDPGRWSSTHYHICDQFQILCEGTGIFGRHTITPYNIHYSRAYTAYGPLIPSDKIGWSMLTLRTRYDPGSQHGKAALDKLKSIPNRKPWQKHRGVTYGPATSDVEIAEIPEIKDDHGLFAHKLIMAPNAQTIAPDPSNGDGQFIVVLMGSLNYEGKEHEGLSVVFVKPQDHAFKILAGSKGLQGLILNFPQV